MRGLTALNGEYYRGDQLDRVMGLQAAFTGFGGLPLALAATLSAVSFDRS